MLALFLHLPELVSEHDRVTSFPLHAFSCGRRNLFELEDELAEVVNVAHPGEKAVRAELDDVAHVAPDAVVVVHDNDHGVVAGEQPAETGGSGG